MNENDNRAILSTEEFFQNVITSLENQLKEFSPAFHVETVKSEDLIQITVRNGSQSYPVIFEEWVAEELKGKDPFGLDKKIWKELRLVGLQIEPNESEDEGI